MACGKETPLNMDEALRNSATGSPVKGRGSAQQPIDVEDSDGGEATLVHSGSATNASISTASSEVTKTSEHSDTVTESEAMGM